MYFITIIIMMFFFFCSFPVVNRKRFAVTNEKTHQLWNKGNVCRLILKSPDKWKLSFLMRALGSSFNVLSFDTSFAFFGFFFFTVSWTLTYWQITWIIVKTHDVIVYPFGKIVIIKEIKIELLLCVGGR